MSPFGLANAHFIIVPNGTFELSLKFGNFVFGIKFLLRLSPLKLAVVNDLSISNVPLSHSGLTNRPFYYDPG